MFQDHVITMQSLTELIYVPLPLARQSAQRVHAIFGYLDGRVTENNQHGFIRGTLYWLK